jgi:hypothetical protein
MKATRDELQGLLLRFAEEAARLYTRSAGVEMPERFMQDYCAAELMRLGFVVTTEVGKTKFREWFGVAFDPDLDAANFFVDLIVYHHPDDGNPDKAKPWALVEFKKSAQEVDSDISRTGRLVRKLIGRGYADVFGYVIACPTCFFDRPVDPRETQKADGVVGATKQLLNQRLLNNATLYSATFGFPVNACEGWVLQPT